MFQEVINTVQKSPIVRPPDSWVTAEKYTYDAPPAPALAVFWKVSHAQFKRIRKMFH